MNKLKERWNGLTPIQKAGVGAATLGAAGVAVTGVALYNSVTKGNEARAQAGSITQQLAQQKPPPDADSSLGAYLDYEEHLTGLRRDLIDAKGEAANEYSAALLPATVLGAAAGLTAVCAMIAIRPE